MLEPHFRSLTESERRRLRARLTDLGGNTHPPWLLPVVGPAVFGILWALTLIASDAPWHVVTVFWLVVGGGIVLWVRRDMTKGVAAMDEMRDRVESALRADRVEVLDVRSRAFVSFEEVEDEGACYAFEVSENTLFFLSGQQYYEAAKFPSLDFSLVRAVDERGRVVDEWIEKRGTKAKPERVIPRAVKRRLDLPDDGATLEGTVADVEGLLSGYGINGRRRDGGRS